MANNNKNYDNPYVPGQQDYSSPSKPLSEILRIAIDGYIRDHLNVWVPAQVTNINPSGYVDVQILIKELFLVQGPVTVPIILNVPVEMPRGNNYSIQLPIAVGDTGRIVFCDRSLDVWKLSGGGPLNPKATRMHDLSDGVFIPGLYPSNNPLTGDPKNLTITNNQSQIVIDPDGTFKIQNQQNELIDLLTQTLQALTEATTNTIWGPMMLNNFDTFQEILIKMQTLQG